MTQKHQRKHLVIVDATVQTVARPRVSCFSVHQKRLNREKNQNFQNQPIVRSKVLSLKQMT